MDKTKQVDHWVEARKWLDVAEREAAEKKTAFSASFAGIAQVHSNLAIAAELKSIGDILFRDLEERKGYGH